MAKTGARAIAGAWVIVQHHEEDAIKFDFTVGSQEIGTSSGGRSASRSGWSCGCDDGHDDIRE